MEFAQTILKMANDKNCVICTKITYDPYECENRCDRIYCSAECAKHFHIEDDVPGSCPGVYWCRLCREEYLNFAKGHNWLHEWHEPSTDLGIYVNSEVEKTGTYLPKCSKCGMWGFEFKSFTNKFTKYEDKSCYELIRQ